MGQDLKISQLPAVTNPLSGDVLPLVNYGYTKKITLAQINKFATDYSHSNFLTLSGGAIENLTVNDDLIVKGNLTVEGELSYIDTQITSTSAMVIDAETSDPALRITQRFTGDVILVEDSQNPDSTPFVVKNDGKVGIGTNTPEAKLTIAGTLSTSNTVNVGGIGQGEDNSVVILDSNGFLRTDEINPQVWDTTANFVSASDGSLTVNRLIKATNANGINESNIFDNGVNVGIGTNTPNKELTIIGSISSTGQSFIAEPIAFNAATTKNYVDTLSANLQTNINILSASSQSSTSNLSSEIYNTFVKLTENRPVTINNNLTANNILINNNLSVVNNISALGTVTVGNIGSNSNGTSFVIENNGLLQKRSLNTAALNTTSKFVSASDGNLTVNYLTKATTANGINESIISDDGSLVYVGGNLTVSGNLTALGSASFANTVFTTTSALSVVNYGPGPALYVYQAPGVSDVASFYDGDGVEILHVGNCDPGQQFGKIGVNTGDPNKELTVVGDISAKGIVYATNVILSGKSLEEVVTTTSIVTADIAAGSIAAGDVVPVGTSLQKFVEQLLLKTFYPTFTNPSASMSSNLASTVESGTTGITLTVNLNRGAITGKTVSGIWQPATFQDYRSGVATNYIINGINNSTTNSLVSSTAIIKDGSNSFSSTTSYAQGPQPVDSKNVSYSTPLASGSLNASMIVTGARRGFYGVSSLANTSALIRGLGSSTNPGISNGTSFTINIPIGATSVIFAYPSTLQNVTTVKYVEGLNAEVKTNFTQTTVAVEGLNSYTAINYKVYRYTPVEPFPATATYTVTI